MTNGTNESEVKTPVATGNPAIRPFQMPLTEIRLSQGLMEKVKPGGMVTVTNSSVILTGRDHIGPFQMDISLKNVQKVENHATYIEGMKRDRKKYMDMFGMIDGYLYHVGLKGKDPEQLYDVIKESWERCKPVKKE